MGMLRRWSQSYPARRGVYRPSGLKRCINYLVRDPARFARFTRLYNAMQEHYAKVDYAKRKELQELESESLSIMIYPKDYIVWDLETSGLDPTSNKILEIGAMKVVNGEIVEKKNWVLNHGIEIPPEITQLTGITKEIIETEGVEPRAAMTEFLALITSAGTNLTHNGYRFDLPFLVKAMGADEIVWHQEEMLKGCIDSAVLYKARALNGDRWWNENFLDFAARVMEIRAYGVKYNVAHCCQELGIDTSQATFHRALGDIYLTNEIYKKLPTVGTAFAKAR